MIDSCFVPEEKSKHEVVDEKEPDDEEAETRLDRAAEDADLQGEAFDGDPSNGEREINSNATP